MKKIIFLIASIVLISGCSATGERFSGLKASDNNNAHLYIYRPSRFFQGGTWPGVFINDEPTFALKNGGYVHYVLPPGPYRLKIAPNDFLGSWVSGTVETQLNLEAMQHYFYRLDLGLENMFFLGNYVTITGNSGLRQIQEEAALEELSELNSSM